MSLARHLRKNPAPAERKLWRKLRNRQFVGRKFRRQHPVGGYVLDFYCPELRLAIELDGGGHAYMSRQISDGERTKFLTDQGIAVLRFWNRQIYRDFHAVCEAIWFAVQDRTNRNPSP